MRRALTAAFFFAAMLGGWYAMVAAGFWGQPDPLTVGGYIERAVAHASHLSVCCRFS